uniref:Ig-like domain-containing protein n=1 Tax=Catharus ustulatus TaxID=91951 RepID=A0A8C3UM96_CATUS
MPVEHAESSPAPLLPGSSSPPSKLPPLQPGHTQGTSLLHSHLGAQELTVREGDPGTFQCNMKGGDMGRYYMYWYRQHPQGSLELISREDDYYGEGFQDRFKGRVENSNNIYTLQILAAKQGDAAMYYCATRITLKQLCSRMDQKLPKGVDRYLSISF